MNRPPACPGFLMKGDTVNHIGVALYRSSHRWTDSDHFLIACQWHLASTPGPGRRGSKLASIKLLNEGHYNMHGSRLPPSLEKKSGKQQTQLWFCSPPPPPQNWRDLTCRACAVADHMTRTRSDPCISVPIAIRNMPQSWQRSPWLWDLLQRRLSVFKVWMWL